MSRLAAFSFCLCFLILLQPASQVLGQDAKPEDPPPLKAAGLTFPHPNCDSALFSPDGRLLVTKSVSSIIVWDALNGKTVGKPISVQSDNVTAHAPVEISADGKFLIVIPPLHLGIVKAPYELRWWELPGLKPVGEPLKLARSSEVIWRVAVGPAGLFLTAETDKKAYKAEICLRELATGKLVGKPWTVDGWVFAVAFSPDGKQVFIDSRDPRNKGVGPSVQRYDVSNGMPVGDAWSHPQPAASIGVSSDGKSAATVSGNPPNFLQINRWKNVEKGKGPPSPNIIAPLQIDRYGVFPLPMVAIHKDSWTVAVATKDKLSVQILSLETGKTISPDLKHSEPVYRLKFSADGKRLLTASGTDAKHGWLLWDVASGKRIGHVPQMGAIQNIVVRPVAFRPDGKALITGDADGTLTLWELPTQK